MPAQRSAWRLPLRFKGFNQHRAENRACDSLLVLRVLRPLSPAEDTF